MKLGCVVMAAGSSRRFGSNKLLQVFRGRPLFRWALDAVPEGLFSAVCVVTGYPEIEAAAEAMGYQVVHNDRPEEGVSRTIRLGLEPFLHCDGVVFMTADQPLLSSRTLQGLADAFGQWPHGIFAAACHGKRGNPCLFPRDLFEELLALEGDTGGSQVIKSHPDRLRLLEVPAGELADCDTAQALQDLEKTPEKQRNCKLLVDIP